jgi:Protein of unknown function (DUF2735)
MKSTNSETAKIYAFPLKRRVAGAHAQSAVRGGGGSKNSYPVAEFGSGWYHDAAIKEASPEGKH